MNLPNLITLIRVLFMIPLFIYLMHVEMYFPAMYVFVLAGVTDILDGIIARKMNLVTKFGKIADPVADKLFEVAVLVMLVIKDFIPTTLLAVVVVKEVLMISGGIYAYLKNKKVISAKWYGKVATIIFYISVALIIVLPELADLLIWISVTAALISLVLYTINFVKIQNKN
jgi:cardiolipin synthase